MSSLLALPSRILLTGATSGIGAAMLDALLASGHQVTAVSRSAKALATHAGLDTIDADFADPAALERLAARFAAEPAYDVLINNAALQYAVPLTDPAFDPAMLTREAVVNLVAPARLAHAVLPAMLAAQRPAAIVNISSGLALFPKTRTALYCATKAGLHSFSQSLRYQLAGSSVRVVEAVLPLVDTPMTAGRGNGKIDPKSAADAILGGIASGRDEIWVGKAALLRWLGVIAPAIPRAILRRA
jgi:uncharacterized oxidoreductase